MSDGRIDAVQRTSHTSFSVSQKQDSETGLPLPPLLGFVSVWLGGSWLVVGAWLHPLIPGGWLTIAAGLALVVVPMRTLVRGLQDATRGHGTDPEKRNRRGGSGDLMRLEQSALNARKRHFRSPLRHIVVSG